MKKQNIVLITILLLVAMAGVRLSYAEDNETKFYQAFVDYPDNMQYWEQQDKKTRALLERFQPRIFVAPHSYRPIDFYGEHLGDCVVRSVKKGGAIVHKQVDQALLKKICLTQDHYLDYKHSASYVLNLQQPIKPPKIYGRIYQTTFKANGQDVELLFLKYSLVFPFSGLPKKNGFLQNLGSHLIGDPRSWHELDIHGSMHVIVDAVELRPLGVLLAQHNHHRVFLRDIDFPWPQDNQVKISIAAFSNEPYLLPETEMTIERRTVGNPIHVEYLFYRNSSAPLGSGMDVVYSKKAGALEIELQLELLPLDDPLYLSWMCLGDRKKLLGIWDSWYLRGPPGIDFYTFPELKNLGELTAFWTVSPDDDEFFRLVKKHIKSFEDYDVEPVLDYQRKRFMKQLQKVINKKF